MSIEKKQLIILNQYLTIIKRFHWSTIGAKRYRSSRMVAGSGIEPLTSGL